jgi:WD40 repeat protein
MMAVVLAALGLRLGGFSSIAVGEVPRTTATLAGHTDSVTSLAYSPDGTTLASASADRTVRLWDVATKKQISSFKGPAAVTSVLFSADGKTVVAAGRDGAIRLWDIATMKNVSTLQGHTDSVLALALSRDGKILASGSKDKTVKLWDISSGKNTATLEAHEAEVRGVAFSPDGKTLASVSQDKTCRLWDVASGKNSRNIQEGQTQHAIAFVAFTPDGKHLVTQQPDVIKKWDVVTGKGERLYVGYSFGGNDGEPLSASFRPDGKLLVGGLRNGTILLWMVSNGRKIAKHIAGTGSVLAVAFSPDGKWFASGSGTPDHLIKIWPVYYADQAAERLDGLAAYLAVGQITFSACAISQAGFRSAT